MPFRVPQEYRGREQTYHRHRVLREYLVAWAHKLGSGSRKRSVRLWYVDCFAGPWQAKAENLRDTSIAIGLGAIEEAAATWSDAGSRIHVRAIFVEKDAAAFRKLHQYLARRKGSAECQAFQGEFGDHVGEILSRIGEDAAFLFVDPTGWDGAAMKYIAPLARARYRDVLVNVMFNHINRFKDDPREFLRRQMREFFGLEEGEIPAHLDEEGLIAFYRDRLKETASVPFAADLAVPHPTHERTWYRLVVAGRSTAVLELFRAVERKVMGEEAGIVRQGAAQRRREVRSSQPEFDFGVSPPDRRFHALRDAGLRESREAVLRVLEGGEHVPFGRLWPGILERFHVTKSDMAAIVAELHEQGQLVVEDWKPKQKLPRDKQTVRRVG